jgi:hypothetical protein
VLGINFSSASMSAMTGTESAVSTSDAPKSRHGAEVCIVRWWKMAPVVTGFFRLSGSESVFVLILGLLRRDGEAYLS